jgi:hypothetical protein
MMTCLRNACFGNLTLVWFCSSDKNRKNIFGMYRFLRPGLTTQL